MSSPGRGVALRRAVVFDIPLQPAPFANHLIAVLSRCTCHKATTQSNHRRPSREGRNSADIKVTVWSSTSPVNANCRRTSISSLCPARCGVCALRSALAKLLAITFITAFSLCSGQFSRHATTRLRRRTRRAQTRSCCSRSLKTPNLLDGWPYRSQQSTGARARTVSMCPAPRHLSGETSHPRPD